MGQLNEMKMMPITTMMMMMIIIIWKRNERKPIAKNNNNKNGDCQCVCVCVVFVDGCVFQERERETQTTIEHSMSEWKTKTKTKLNENIFVWYVIRIIRKESREKERIVSWWNYLYWLFVFGDVKGKYVWQTSQHNSTE